MIRQKDLVFLLISSAIVVFVWIGATLYHAAVTSKIQEPLSSLIRPITAQFDPQAIAHITARQETIPTYEASGSRLPTPSVPQASGSGAPRLTETPSPTPTAVPGGDQAP